MDDSKGNIKSTYTLVMRAVLRLVEFVFLLLCWLAYAFTTLDRSEQALAYTGGNPLPGKFSFLVLALILTFFFRKSLFVKKWSFALVVQRLVVFVVVVFGLTIYFTSNGT